MSKQLIESIIDKNFILAESHFNDRLNAIMEKKLYEKKRQVAADMDEAFGGLTKKEIEDRKKKGYVKASDVLQDPRDIKISMRKKESAKRKKVSEAVDVQPDPESRVRGGKAKPVKGTFKRKFGAAAIKAVRKGSRVVGDIGSEIVGRASAAKQAYQAHKKSQQSSDTDVNANLRKTFGVEKSTDRKMPGLVKRNVNTLLGREPDYDKSKLSQDDKIKKSGRLGKFVRGQAGEVLSNIKSAASSTWE